MDQLENNVYIRETCPKCGSPLLNIELTTYPPIPRKECTNCGWSWQGSPAKIVDVPFKEDEYITKPSRTVDVPFKEDEYITKPSRTVDVPFKEDEYITKINIDEMRDATEEERKSTRDYIDSISYVMGKNILDITNPEDKKEFDKVHIIYGDSKGNLYHVYDPEYYRFFDNGRIVQYSINKENHTVCSDYIEIIEKED